MGMPAGFQEAQRHPTLGGCPLKASRAEPSSEAQIQRLTKQWRARLGAETRKKRWASPAPREPTVGQTRTGHFLGQMLEGCLRLRGARRKQAAGAAGVKARWS